MIRLLFLLFFSFQTYVFSLEDHQDSIVQVIANQQKANYHFPWLKKEIIKLDGFGFVFKNNQIITLASLVEGKNTRVSVKKHSSYIEYAANIVKIDFDSNLAILEVAGTGFWKDLSPMDLEEDIQLMESLVSVQLDNSGSIQQSDVYSSSLGMDYSENGNVELPQIYSILNEQLEGIGEVILKNDKVLGLLSQTNENKNEGKIIPSSVIKLFIESAKPFPYKGFRYRPLIDQTQRDYYGLKEGEEGVLISKLIQNGTGWKELKVGDVIIEIENFKIDSKGFFIHRKFGKQPLSYLFHIGVKENNKVGERIKIKIIRTKQTMDLELELKEFPIHSLRIQREDNGPNYIVEGGFIFIELSRNYLEDLGKDWRSRIDRKILYLYDYHRDSNDVDNGKIILMSSVLPDEFNEGYHDLHLQIVKKVNSKKVININNLNEIIQYSQEEFINILFDSGIEIVLEKNKLKEANKRIADQYKINKLKSITDYSSNGKK